MLGLGFEHSPVDVITGLVEVIVLEEGPALGGHSDKLAVTGSQAAHWNNNKYFSFMH